jgi:hypothetical protein
MNTLKMALAGGVAVAALAMSGGTAEAQIPACGPGLTVDSVTAQGFTCQDQDKIYSNFSATNLPGESVVAISFLELGNTDQHIVSVFFNPVLTADLTQPAIFQFDIAVDLGQKPEGRIVGADLGITVTVPPGTAGTTQVVKDFLGGGDGTSITCNATAGGDNCGPSVSFTGVTSLTVRDTISNLTDTATLSSIQNTIIQELEPVDMPEPVTLAAFGIGLAGLGFAARRRRAA